MKQMPSIKGRECSFNMLTEPTLFNELQYSEIIKPIDSKSLRILDTEVDALGKYLIDELSRSARLQKEIAETAANPHLLRGKRVGIAGAGGVGASFLAIGSLAKIIFVSGLIFSIGGVAELLYSGFILSMADGSFNEIMRKAQITAGVQEKMRLIIASRLEHNKKDQLVKRGIKKFDQHDKNIDKHGLKLIAHNKRLTTSEVKIQGFTKVNMDQAKKLAAQKNEIQEHKKKLTEQSATIKALVQRLNALEERDEAKARSGGLP